MNAFLEAVEEAERALDLVHLVHLGESTVGEEWRKDFRTALAGGFDGVREALRMELADLRRWQLLGFSAGVIGLVLLGIGILLVFAGILKVGIVTALGGLLTEILPVVLFSRVEKTRRSLWRLLPEYRNIFGVLTVVDYAEDAGELQRRVSSVGQVRGSRGSAVH